MTRKILQGEKISVLVVDDDEYSRAIFQKKLGLLGLTAIQEAVGGQDAVLTLDQMPRPPDFLICDIFMPDMDGIEFVGELAKRNFKGGLVLVTGVNQDMLDVATEIATLKGLRVVGAFTKPVQQESLGKALGIPVV